MKYALLIYGSSAAIAEADGDGYELSEDWLTYTQALKDMGALIAIERLQAADTATSVRLRDGERILTDGPFIETKEHLLGFCLVELADLDEAIDWAARMPHRYLSTVEVRPVLPTPDLAQIVMA